MTRDIGPFWAKKTHSVADVRVVLCGPTLYWPRGLARRLRAYALRDVGCSDSFHDAYVSVAHDVVVEASLSATQRTCKLSPLGSVHIDVLDDDRIGEQSVPQAFLMHYDPCRLPAIFASVLIFGRLGQRGRRLWLWRGKYERQRLNVFEKFVNNIKLAKNAIAVMVALNVYG